MDRRRISLHLLTLLNRDAERLARHFGLVYRSIEAERANVKKRYGVCYSDGSIRIRLFHATTGNPLKYSSLISTLCHELAHLRHFDHGQRFRDLYLRILERARREGIYRPGRTRRLPERAVAGGLPPLRPHGHATSRPPSDRGALPEQLALF